MIVKINGDIFLHWLNMFCLRALINERLTL